MALERSLMTADELLRLPDDDRHYELVRGALTRMSPAGARHSVIAGRIVGLLYAHAEPRGLGAVLAAEPGFILARRPDTVRAPDVAFVARDRLPDAGAPDGFWPFAPDLAVEVVSPSERPAEVAAKVADYLAAGTRLLWVVRPGSRTVAEHRPGRPARTLGQGDEMSGHDVLPGLRLPVRRLF